MSMEHTKRRTGRTTRMVEYAKAQAKAGRAVYIIASSESERWRIEAMIGDDSMGIKVETAGSLGNLDWQSMALRGSHPNCLVLCDHYAIESRFRVMLEELTRYDAPPDLTATETHPRETLAVIRMLIAQARGMIADGDYARAEEMLVGALEEMS